MCCRIHAATCIQRLLDLRQLKTEFERGRLEPPNREFPHTLRVTFRVKQEQWLLHEAQNRQLAAAVTLVKISC